MKSLVSLFALSVLCVLGGSILAKAQSYIPWTQPDGAAITGQVLNCATGVGRTAVPCGTAGNPIAIAGAVSGTGIAAPAASSSIMVQRTANIGTAGTLVSAADPTNRRTVTNTSGIACELMGSAAAYGTGFPLPAGGFFTFDASGRTTAALYVACASAGGSVAVMSY